MIRQTPDELRDTLRDLYARRSKHSSYQSIPQFISDILGYQEDIRREWRDDRNRYDYILSQVTPRPGERWVDFGANTGFFTFSLAHAYPESQILAVEANPDHASFLSQIGAAFGIDNVRVCSEAIGLDRLDELKPADVMLHLNVLHHAGSDFDAHHVTNQESFHPYATRYLDRLRSSTRTLVLQIGFNLWGNKSLPLFSIADSTAALREIVSLLWQSGWAVRAVAYPVNQPGGGIAYVNLPAPVLATLAGGEARCDWAMVGEAIPSAELGSHIGEFYHRPLFVLGHP